METTLSKQEIELLPMNFDDKITNKDCLGAVDLIHNSLSQTDYDATQLVKLHKLVNLLLVMAEYSDE